MSSVVSENMVAIDDFIKYVSFQPRFLRAIYIKTLGLHQSNQMLVARVVVWFVGQWVALGITGLAA